MIKPEELRMNNYVSINEIYRNEGDLLMLTQKNYENLIVNNAFERIFPLKITENWLNDFNFIYDGDLFIYRFKEFCFKDYGFKEIGILKYNYFSWYNCEYIHQLQNIYFALTGDDLIIKNK